jgi:hypothetical protein
MTVENQNQCQEQEQENNIFFVNPHAVLLFRLSVVVTTDPMGAPMPVIASAHWEVQHTIVLGLFVQEQCLPLNTNLKLCIGLYS